MEFAGRTQPPSRRAPADASGANSTTAGLHFHRPDHAPARREPAGHHFPESLARENLAHRMNSSLSARAYEPTIGSTAGSIARAVAELRFGGARQRQVQQAQVDAHRAGARAFVAAHAAPGQVHGARDVPGEIALRCGEVSMACGRFLSARQRSQKHMGQTWRQA